MILHSRLLQRFPWVEHGFGTRLATVSQDQMASLRQIHSAVPLRADRAPGCVGSGDALLTNRAGVGLSIRTADCFPILLADPTRRVVAAVHAGWRGAADGIAPATLDKMSAEFGTDPAHVHAAIGPGIGVCCYQVGVEVARRFGQNRAGRLDLAEENRRQLVQAGVPESQIENLNLCTRCDPARFHSWRRDQQAAGRMISFIRLRAVPLTP